MSEIPTTMKAMVLTGHGGLDKYEWRENWPVPVPGREEVLVRVEACGLNNTDVNTRTGWYSKSVSGGSNEPNASASDSDDGGWGGALTFPKIQGGDAVGTVVAAGDDANQSLVGKRVMIDTILRDWSDPLNMDKCGYFGSECDGGFAEYTKIDHRNALPVDSNLTSAELATFAISYSTAENMLSRANVRDGDTILIAGASGGVGSALVQLANRRGATTIAMASESKHQALRDVSPDVLLPREPTDLKEALRKATGKETVSVVADIVGGQAWPGLIETLERGGRYTCSGAIAGPIVELDLRTLYLHDLTFTGATILPPNIFPDLVGYIERDEVKPLLAATYPLRQLAEAQQVFIDKVHVGNIVVTVD